MLRPRVDLVRMISPPLDASLTHALVDSFADQEARFSVGDFGPATLNGGRFCEAVARILYHIDSGVLSEQKELNACLSFVEDDRNEHLYSGRDSALQICRVLRSVYKVRSKRGAVHLSPHYTANEMDARYVVESCRWIFGELLRLHWNERETRRLGVIVQDLVRYEVPLIWEYDGRPLVLRVGLTAADEILLILRWYGTLGASRADISTAVKRPAQTISNTLTKLTSAKDRRAVRTDAGRYVLTQLGLAHLHDVGLLRESIGGVSS